MSNETTCGFVPYPRSGAYGSWICQRKRRHLGSHRFNNYTVVRIPRVWHIKQLLREFQLGRKLRRYAKEDCRPAGADYRRALYPAAYRPVPVAGRVLDGDSGSKP